MSFQMGSQGIKYFFVRSLHSSNEFPEELGEVKPTDRTLHVRFLHVSIKLNAFLTADQI